MQAPRKVASHEPQADESNLGVKFVEFCYWHLFDVISSSSGYLIAPWRNRLSTMRCT